MNDAFYKNDRVRALAVKFAIKTKAYDELHKIYEFPP